jgi:hypothetical protein
MSVCTFFIGYVTDSLPDVHINDVDRIVIHAIRSLFRLKWTKDSFARRPARERAIEKLMNAFSDQAVIPSMAFGIAAFAKCDTSLYSFLMSIMIIWMSITVQLYALLPLKR